MHSFEYHDCRQGWWQSEEENSMRIHMGIKVFLIFTFLLTVGVPLFAQNQNSAPATVEKKYDLLSGLDTRLIDRSADPCVDFFQYACGRFELLYPIPSDRSGFGTGAMIAEYTESTVRAMLEKTATENANRSPNEQKIGDYYASCMDEAAIDAKELAPLKPELDRIAALQNKSELTDLLAHYQLIGVGAFLGYGEAQDFKDARKQIAVVDQGGLGLPERDYYLRTSETDEKLRKEYIQHITTMLKLMGEPEAKAGIDAQSIMKLETALAKNSMDVTSRRVPKNIYHLIPLVDFANLTPAIDWTRFLQQTGTPPVTEINVATPEFFKGLNALLESTDMDTIKTYLRWQFLLSVPGTTLPKALDQENFAFFGQKLTGQPMQRARWKRCVRATDNALGEAVGQVYVAEEFPPASKQATVQMVHDIEGAMDQEVDALDWMSAETKVRAKQKLHAVADKIGYPDHWRDYAKLEVIRGDAYGNAVRAAIFESRRQLAKIGKPVDRGEWGMSPATVDAYYNPSMNDINFPAGILQPPLYDKNATDAENYGHIGAIVGHELIHGFDDEGRQFDGDGNLSDWWAPEDEKKFEEKTDCEVKEYSSFTVVDDVKINGKLTLGENTADNGGLLLAYVAFLADAKRKNIDLTQKQDGYHPIQQFFIGFGQSWCGSARPESIRLQAQTDPHSYRRYRVNGVVQNMPEFGEAFGCKVGQPMMPQHVCHVW
jgi:putative endopeptidase